MGFDPTKFGAKCGTCPLNGCKPVPAENNADPLMLLAGQVYGIVGEAPGETEEKLGIPFVGASGRELDRALKIAKLDRRKAVITNVLACRPPKNKLDVLLRKISKANREATKKWKKACRDAETAGEAHPPAPDVIPSPIDCCKPRFEHDIQGLTNFITLGKYGTSAVTGAKASILKIRGGLMELEGTDRTPHRRVMPTVHPAFVLRAQRWAHVFRNDIYKAAKWFRGESEWKPPNILRQPTPDQLSAFLKTHGRSALLSSDIETDGIECLTAKIRCIAIGTPTDVVVVTTLSNNGQTRFYSHSDEQEIIASLKDYFEGGEFVGGHNFGYYDKLVLKYQWGIEVTNIIDTMLLHKSVESDLPHGLGYVGSMYADAPAWKTDREGNKLSTDAESDEELATYCAYDTGVTAMVMQDLIDTVKVRDQLHVWHQDTKMQAICAEMHEVGMYVDQEVRLKIEKEFLGKRHSVLKELRDRTGRAEFNPGSVYQVRDLLFDTWKLEPDLVDEDRLTASDDPSTADLVLRALLTDAGVPKEQRDVLKLIRRYRKMQKLLGTYVVKLRPSNLELDKELGWDDEEDWVDKETRKRYGLAKRGIVNPNTGRMYPGWNAHVTVTGRLSSSKPINAQNFPSPLRKMVTAAPGNVLVGADMDQLELRIAAALWNISIYLRAFQEGKDPHSMTAFSIFGDQFAQLVGCDPAMFFDLPGKLVGKSYDENGTFIGTGQDYDLRRLAKTVQFAFQYMAGVETGHKVIQKTEVPARDPKTGKPRGDGTTDLPYALMKQRRTRGMRDKWLDRAHEIQAGWDREINQWKKQGFLTEARLLGW